MSTTTLASIVSAFRPKTLTAAVVPCVAASCLAFAYGELHVEYLLWAVLSAVCIQVGTNLVNDAVDFKKGADNEERMGPQRITQAGILSFKQVMALGSLFFLLAVLFGIPLVMRGGWPLVGIGLISVLMGYAYTAGPYPLAYRGLGDLFVIIFFGLVAVAGMFYLHTLQVSQEVWVLGLQIGFLATVLIAINNLRDIEGDRKVGKRTMAVRFGEKFSKMEIAFLVFAPFALNIYWMVKGYWVAGLIPWLTLPLAMKLYKNIQSTSPGPVYNQYLAQAAALHLFFGVIIGVGLLW